MKLRFGIMGAADIARKNWKAIRNSGNATVAAVASRDLDRCRAFVAACEMNAPMTHPVRMLTSYDALIASPEVDAVYIPLPTGLRAHWVTKAARAGKHVVCEKPCATSLEELRLMQEVCRENRVQFMDGVMFMHSQRLGKLRAELDTSIGSVKRIASAFSVYGDEKFFANNIRADKTLEPFGALGDLGWYNIRLSLWAMGEQLPITVTGRILRETNNIVSEFSGELFFADGASSTFYCSFVSAFEQWAQITGTTGLVRLHDFVLPSFGDTVGFDVFSPQFAINVCDYNIEPHHRRISMDEYSNSHATAQETNLFRNFTAQVQSGKLNGDWFQYPYNTQRVMEACLLSARRESVTVDL
jgi:predicted dehydrogenase